MLAKGDAQGSQEAQEASGDPGNPALLVVRSTLGGVLMGLANLVPGISGGTMLLAAGTSPVRQRSQLKKMRRNWYLAVIAM